MVVLVINNGSSSLKFSIIETSTNLTLAQGSINNIGSIGSYIKYEIYKGIRKNTNIKINNHSAALDIMCDYIFDNNIGVLNSVKDIDVIGHRVVHGGEKYTHATIVNDQVLKDIDELSILAPIHNKVSLNSIIDCQKKFPNTDNVAVFDTSFHTTIPKENFMYAIPKELYEKYKIRKYGFHGISYNYVLDRYSNIISKEKNNISTVICHLGGGCSMCAIKNGKSIDTTMEYTPLSGLIMANRSGTLDPAIIPRIMEIYNITSEEVIKILNNKSGYLAIANDKDAKNIVERSEKGDSDSILLRKMVNHDFKKNLLSMMSNLDSIDSIIMTGGMGSKNIDQRELFLSNLDYFGLKLDKDKNKSVFDIESIISAQDSKIPIYVIPTNEELEIAKQCQKIKNTNK